MQNMILQQKKQHWYFNDTFHVIFLDKWKQNLDGLATGTLMEHFQVTATSP